MNFYLLAISILFAMQANSQDAVSYVDPQIGNVGIILEPTVPLAHLPNQMVRSYPKRADYLDNHIWTFPLSLISHRKGLSFGIMPFTGKTEKGMNPVSNWDAEIEELTLQKLKQEDIKVQGLSKP
jgi:hypothetical protein